MHYCLILVCFPALCLVALWCKVATDDVLPDGSFLPRDTFLVYDIYSMGRDTKIWGQDMQAE
eukprot:2263463-Amphidinium_carterae.3